MSISESPSLVDRNCNLSGPSKADQISDANIILSMMKYKIPSIATTDLSLSQYQIVTTVIGYDNSCRPLNRVQAALIHRVEPYYATKLDTYLDTLEPATDKKSDRTIVVNFEVVGTDLSKDALAHVTCVSGHR